MNRSESRHVCLRDLKDYCKKSDYLSGYTDQEQKTIRDNLGITTEETRLIEITYEELYNIYLAHELKVGYKYLIKDFQTIYSSNTVVNGVYQTWGYGLNPSEVWKLIVTPITNSELNPYIIVLSDSYDSTKWTVRYDITKETLPDGITTKGKITYLLDENNNSAYYDFKNILFQENSILRFNNILSTFNEESFNVHLSPNTYETVFIKSVSNLYVFGNCTNNIFTSTCKDCKIVNCTNSLIDSELNNVTLNVDKINLSEQSILCKSFPKRVVSTDTGNYLEFTDYESGSIVIEGV